MGKRRNGEPPDGGIIRFPEREPKRSAPVRRPRTLVLASTSEPATPAGETRLLAMEGPIPPSEALREYDAVVPGLAARIVEWAEREAEQRRAVEMQAVRMSWGGMWCALTVALTTIVGGMLLAWGDHSTAGLIGIVTALAGLVIIFLAGRRRMPADSVAAPPAS
jgi:uncharacterized membrane protein